MPTIASRLLNRDPACRSLEHSRRQPMKKSLTGLLGLLASTVCFGSSGASVPSFISPQSSELCWCGSCSAGEPEPCPRARPWLTAVTTPCLSLSRRMRAKRCSQYSSLRTHLESLCGRRVPVTAACKGEPKRWPLLKRVREATDGFSREVERAGFVVESLKGLPMRKVQALSSWRGLSGADLHAFWEKTGRWLCV
jgi:hypothetical protein